MKRVGQTAIITMTLRISCNFSVLAAAITCFLGFTSAGLAANYAVLVGVSNYELERVSDLKGPPNDVEMMKEALMAKGVLKKNISILTDGAGVEGAVRPTREAIMAALNGVIGKLDEDEEDFVTLYFSGHGTRQADQNKEEADGLDELFLPIDIKQWGGSSEAKGLIPNAIVDDEIGDIVKKMRARNATVWVIMDSCHSGSGTRFAQNGVRARQVSPDIFGIKADPLAVTVDEDNDDVAYGGRDQSEPQKGGFVAFFAAQSFQQAIEVDMEIGEGGETKAFGLFTAHLAQRLMSDRQLTFRQLFDAVKFDIEKYQADRSGSQWPAWEASANTWDLVPMTKGKSTNQTWELDPKKSMILAGQLHGLRDGSILSVYEDPAASDDQERGHIQIVKSYALTSKYKVIDYPCDDSNSGSHCKSLSTADISGAMFSRLKEPAVNVELKLSPPQILDDDDYSELIAALDAVKTMSEKGELGLKVVFDQNPYHVSLGLKDGQLWFGDSDGLASAGVSNVPSSIAWPAYKGAAADVKELAKLISQFGRIHNMATVAKELKAQRRKSGILGEEFPMDVSIQVARSDRATLAKSQYGDLVQECEDISRDPPEELEGTDNLTQCDEITITVQKKKRGHLDVTVLYKDARGAIHVLFPQNLGENRIDGNEPLRLQIFGWPSLVLCAECPSPDGDGSIWSFGREDLYVIAAQSDGTGIVDLSHLAQGALGTVRKRSAKGTGDALSDMLTDLVEGGNRTRGNLRGPRKKQLWIETYSWSVWPRDPMTQQIAGK
jgi:hypothetical protein